MSSFQPPTRTIYASSGTTLVEWEAARARAHSQRSKQAASKLSTLQIRAQNGLASLDAWLAIIESRRKLEEVKAGAATAALDDLEARWRPTCLADMDGEAAAWILAAERSHASQLKAHALQLAAAIPEGGANLRQRYNAVCDELTGPVAKALRAWEAAHTAVEEAWSSHNDLQEKAARAVAEKRAPPDSWLSEVRYRESANAYRADQDAAASLLASCGTSLSGLEEDRGHYWQTFAASYIATAAVGGCESAPPLQAACEGTDVSPAPEVPEMPSTSNGVLLRGQVSMEAPKGLFGFGGGGWCDGAILVLTIHGYLHLFHSDVPKSNVESARDADTLPKSSQEDLKESAIKASVYVPLATKCMFLRRGKELLLDVSEAELGEAASKGGTGDRLRKWIGKAPSGGQLVPRRVHARLVDVTEFGEFERCCQAFVREGQSLRASGFETAPERLEKFTVDNGQLKADAPGLEYRLSKKVEDRAGKDVYERWGDRKSVV